MQYNVRPDVFVIGRFPPPLDGQTIGTTRLAELMAANHEVERVNTSPPDTGFVVAEAKLRPRRAWHYVTLLPVIRRRLKTAPDAAVLWASVSPVPLGHWRDMLTVYPALMTGQSVFAVVHRATFEQVFTSRLTAFSGKRFVDRLKGFVFLNRHLADACAPWIPREKRFVIPNTIESSVLCSPDELLRKRQVLDAHRPMRLLFLAGMMPEKGYRDVLEAVHLLRQQDVAVEATFAGGWIRPEDRVAFERYVDDHALGETVRHLGAVSDRSQVKALHLAADVFLLPSYHPTEAQPIALIEAMNAGTPLVVSRQGGIPDMVRDGREGLMVQARNAEAIAQAIRKLRDRQTWLAMSRNAQERFESTFSPSVVTRQWEQILENTRRANEVQ